MTSRHRTMITAALNGVGSYWRKVVAHVENNTATVAFAEFVPKFSALNQPIGLFPKLHFSQVAIIPAIPNDPVLRGGRAGQVGRLGGASDRRERRNNSGQGAPSAKGANPRRVRADE